MAIDCCCGLEALCAAPVELPVSALSAEHSSYNSPLFEVMENICHIFSCCPHHHSPTSTNNLFLRQVIQSNWKLQNNPRPPMSFSGTNSSLALFSSSFVSLFVELLSGFLLLSFQCSYVHLCSVISYQSALLFFTHVGGDRAIVT